jgi:hypothetical protein
MEDFSKAIQAVPGAREKAKNYALMKRAAMFGMKRQGLNGS